MSKLSLSFQKSINHTAEVTCDNSLLKKIVIGHKMRVFSLFFLFFFSKKNPSGVQFFFKKKILLKQFIEICDETKTRAEFENNDTSSNKLIIKGSESNVSKAKKLIQDYINELVINFFFMISLFSSFLFFSLFLFSLPFFKKKFIEIEKY